ncbi:uncharacterized protein LOC134276266 [Saccostrea cucullata]|uniref:uncharacterized protein LOC134276266 n=1 Tax=Saccostrea cuccullata TaxID=36930 RepID=UPI002ED4D670
MYTTPVIGLSREGAWWSLRVGGHAPPRRPVLTVTMGSTPQVQSVKFVHKLQIATTVDVQVQVTTFASIVMETLFLNLTGGRIHQLLVTKNSVKRPVPGDQIVRGVTRARVRMSWPHSVSVPKALQGLTVTQVRMICLKEYKC